MFYNLFEHSDPSFTW